VLVANTMHEVQRWRMHGCLFAAQHTICLVSNEQLWIQQAKWEVVRPEGLKPEMPRAVSGGVLGRDEVFGHRRTRTRMLGRPLVSVLVLVLNR